MKSINIGAKVGGAVKEWWERLSQKARRALLLIQLISLSFYAIYLLYEISKGQFVELKLILLGTTIAYAIFYVTMHDRIDKPSKAKRKSGKKLYTFTKILVKGCTLAITFYGISSATVETTFWSVLLAVLMLIGWIGTLLFEIVCYLIDRKIKRLTTSAVGQIKSFTTAVLKRQNNE